MKFPTTNGSEYPTADRVTSTLHWLDMIGCGLMMMFPLFGIAAVIAAFKLVVHHTPK